MSELFDDTEEDKTLIIEDDHALEDDLVVEVRRPESLDARRRLENLMEDKRLRDELEDFLDKDYKN